MPLTLNELNTHREHNIMQAVARVNRSYTENKTYGLIIDHCGISKRLKEALDIFNEGILQATLNTLWTMS